MRENVNVYGNIYIYIYIYIYIHIYVINVLIKKKVVFLTLIMLRKYEMIMVSIVL